MRFLLTCLIAASTVLASSDLARADDWLGLGLGANFSTFTGGDPAAGGSTRFTATAFADWGLGTFWYLETGLRYTSYAMSGSLGDFGYSESADYLEVPVLFKPTFDAGGWFPYLLAGPEVGFKVSQSFDLNQFAVGLPANTFRTVNFSGDFGAGAEFPIRPNIRAFAQFDYELGLLNVIQSGNASAHTRGAVISGGAVMSF